jgi:hypothetical protein
MLKPSHSESHLELRAHRDPFHIRCECSGRVLIELVASVEADLLAQETRADTNADAVYIAFRRRHGRISRVLSADSHVDSIGRSRASVVPASGPSSFSNVILHRTWRHDGAPPARPDRRAARGQPARLPSRLALRSSFLDSLNLASSAGRRVDTAMSRPYSARVPTVRPDDRIASLDAVTWVAPDLELLVLFGWAANGRTGARSDVMGDRGPRG